MKGKLKRDISIPILSREISTVISFGWISRLNKQSMARENKQLVAQFEEDYFFFFFWISNKDLLLSKRETPKYIGSIQGSTIWRRLLFV